MWEALLSLAFFGSLRCAEYTPSPSNPSGPSIGDVCFEHSGKIMLFNVAKSKTQLHGFQCSLACSGHEICARCRMVTYLGAQIRSPGVTAQSPLFVYKGTQVTAKMVNKFVKSIAHSLGWNQQAYSAHSIRAGAATTAALAGFNQWEIKSLGGWGSTAYTGYIRGIKSHTSKFPRRLTRDTASNGPSFGRAVSGPLSLNLA